MFTGLIEETGKVVEMKSTDYGKYFTVSGDKVLKNMALGDSVAINGACQTVVDIKMNKFSFSTIYETLKKTTLNSFTIGQKVNLERAVSLQNRLGGHIVQGHVDTCGKILQITRFNQSTEILISFPSQFRKYLVNTGSICIDGVSLTTAHIFEQSFKVAIIPLTMRETIISTYKIGSNVNLEFDIIGKYVESMLNYSTEKTTLANMINQPE